MPRLTVWVDDKLYDALVEKQAKIQKEKKCSISMSKLIRIAIKEWLHIPDGVSVTV